MSLVVFISCGDNDETTNKGIDPVAYVAGYEYDSKGIATLWENGVAQNLQMGLTMGVLILFMCLVTMCM